MMVRSTLALALFVTACSTGSTGPTGDPGAHGDPGAQGATGLAGAAGPAGAQGAQGSQGAAGETGPAGEAGSPGSAGEAGVIPANGSYSGSFNGDGSALSGLNASNLTSGTVPDARLSGTYSGALTLSNPGNVYQGDGSSLSNVAVLTGGKLPASLFPATVPLLDGTGKLPQSVMPSVMIAPSSAGLPAGSAGKIILNTLDNRFYGYNGTAWVAMSP